MNKNEETLNDKESGKDNEKGFHTWLMSYIIKIFLGPIFRPIHSMENVNPKNLIVKGLGGPLGN